MRTDNFELGNYIHIQCDDKVFDVRLLSIDVDYDNLEELSVIFSDVREKATRLSDAKDILDNAKSLASSYDNVVRQAEQGSSSRERLDDWTTNGLALTSLKIINSAENQDYVFDEHGMLFRKYLPLSDTYSDEQLKIINSTIAITNDNWATVKTAVGSHYYIDPLTNELTYAYGINGEVLIGKIILGEQLGIYNSGATLQFNKNGLYITNGTNSFTLNPNTAENLLSIKSGVNDILTVSSSGLYVKGEIVATSGYIGGTSGWTIKSTYIYNGKSSLSDTTQGVYIGTDGISVGSGSAIFKVTNTGSITITGYATTAGLSGGTTTINGSCIKTGTIDTDRLNVSSIITVGGIATTDDIRTDEEITTITNNTIKTTNVTAVNLTVKAANISGTLTADQINGSGLSVSDANIGNMTITNKLFFGGDSTYYINANYNNNSWFIYTPNFKVDSTNAYFSGELEAASGSFSGTITSSNAVITGGSISFGEGDDYSYVNSSGARFGARWSSIRLQYSSVLSRWSCWDFSDSEGLNELHIGSLPDYWGDGSSCIHGIQAVLDVSDCTYFSIYVSNGKYELGGAGISFYMNSNYTNCYASLTGTWKGTLTSDSDRNLKHDIETLSDKYSILFDLLEPVRFKYNSGTSGRYHTGFVAQDVESAIEQAGLTTDEAALFVRFTTVTDPKEGISEVTYGLRYDEFIALNTWQIQKLKARVAELETIVAKLQGG